jgi:putative transposase
MHPIATLCRVLGVSASGYYAWAVRPASTRATVDAALMEQIRVIHMRSRGTYGERRVHAELAALGVHVGRKRIARLMRVVGLAGVSRRKRTQTTIRDHDARPAPDLVDRDFTATAPDRLWVADITYIPTWAGFLYLAVVLDAWSRRVVGWAMATHLRTELVLEALNMALTQRRPTGVIHHSDQGSTRRSPSDSAAARGASGHRWDPSGTRTTTPSVRASSRRSSASCSIASASRPRSRRAWPSSNSLRGGTTRTVATRPSATIPRSTTRGVSCCP